MSILENYVGILRRGGVNQYEHFILLGMCYILCMSSSVWTLCQLRRRVQGGEAPYAGVWGQHPRKKTYLPKETCHIYRWFFGTWFLCRWFLFPVKELGLLTNPGYWVRVLDVVGSYMYIVL
jgi:hypothetical protein